jgi:hypothetical protein
MSTLISSPFPVFTDVDGLPLENGYIDIGVAGLNPLSNPLQVYFDEALTIPASNIRTTRGYPARNGSAAFLYAPPGDFSILVRNKNNVVIFSNLNVVDNITVIQNDIIALDGRLTTVETDYAPLASPALTGTPTAPTATSETNTTQLATTEFVLQNRHIIGELLLSEFDESTSESFPAVPRNVNQDLDVANWPLLVAKMRAVKTSVLGVTDHAATVAASVVTMPNTAASNALIALLVSDAIVSNYINTSEPANFAGGADYATVSTRRSLNVAGTDYAITGINATLREITVDGVPTAGAQSASCYTYRIAGSSTSARLLRIAGFVGVAAGDAGGEVVGGFRKMDRGQGHRHLEKTSTSTNIDNGSWVKASNFGPERDSSQNTSDPTTDTTNGTPRTGKTTDPRTAGQYAYTWGAQYIP